MKKLFGFAAVCLFVALSFSSCTPNPVKTIENLKAAATGESNASAKYALYAQKAEADSMFNVAAMFRATSAAEAIHSENHLKVLKSLGVEFTPIVEEVVVGTTLENLEDAKKGEDYEQTTMYPDFIKAGQEEKASAAVVSFTNAMIAEGKHSGFYADAIAVITAQGNDSGVTVVGEWMVCPVCGDTYRNANLPAACDLCATPAEQFLKF